LISLSFFKTLFLWLLLASLFACNLLGNSKELDAIARVGDDYLYLSELENLVAGKEEKDSLEIAQAFIDQWIKEKLLIRKAEQNLSEKQLDFEKQLSDYRNSLIIYTYENELVKQKLDTVIREGQYQTYYEANQKNFELKEKLYQARYIEFLNSAPMQDSLKQWFLGTADEVDLEQKLSDYCTQFASACQLDSNRWFSENQWKEVIPLDSSAQYKALEPGFNVYQDSIKTVWVQVNQQLQEGDAAPLAYIKEQIKGIILNQRRLKLIANVKAEIFEEATLKNKYEIYAN
jgi:hypothetical protein